MKKATSAPEQPYNDDLLLREEDRQAAAASTDFGAVIDVLHNQELQECFSEADLRANAAKRRAHSYGVWAVVLAVLALCGAAVEHVWHGLPTPLPRVLAGGFAACGLLALILSIQGGLYGARKSRWLHDRLLTERLRQFHFQTMIWRIADICQASRTGNWDDFRAKRKAWFERVRLDLKNWSEAKFSGILGADGAAHVWLHDNAPQGRPRVPPEFDPEPLFKAYSVLRFGSQLNYAEHKLRRHGWSWRLNRMSLRQQAAFFHGFWAVSFGLLIATHLYILIVQLISRIPPGAAPGWLHLIAICLALVALGVRTIEHGLAVPRELERYEDYRVAVRELKNRFDSTANADERLGIMLEMERLSFEEMRSFLRAYSETSFIL